MAEYINYEIWLGTFINNEFKWTKIEEHDTLKEAMDAFKKYAIDQFSYTDEKLKEVWDSGRLDVELRQGTKLLNWMGIYSRVASEIGKDGKDNDAGKPKEDKDEGHKDNDSHQNDSAERAYPKFKVGDIVVIKFADENICRVEHVSQNEEWTEHQERGYGAKYQYVYDLRSIEGPVIGDLWRDIDEDSIELYTGRRSKRTYPRDSAVRFKKDDLVTLAPSLAGSGSPTVYKVLEYHKEDGYYILDTGKRADGSVSEYDPPFWIEPDQILPFKR